MQQLRSFTVHVQFMWNLYLFIFLFSVVLTIQPTTESSRCQWYVALEHAKKAQELAFWATKELAFWATKEEHGANIAHSISRTSASEEKRFYSVFIYKAHITQGVEQKINSGLV